MSVRIDHVITAARDLDALEATFRRLGFFVTGGGTHPHLGTRNRLVLLGEGYLELLAIADASVASPALGRRLAAGDGWIGSAVQSADVAAEVEVIRARGAMISGPHPGRLVAPDGTARGWRTATLGGDDLWSSAEPLPFLIQHDTGGERHRRELAGADGDQPHPNGAQGLVEVTVAVRDLEAVARRYAAALGLLATEPRRHDAALHADALDLPLTSGERIVLAQPTGPGLAQARLDAAGDGICCVSIRVADLAATASYLRQSGIAFSETGDALHLQPEAAHGAALRFVA